MTDSPLSPGYEQMVTDLMRVQETLGPIFDTADWMRTDLERRGWSPTVAEGMAANWLHHMMEGLMHS